MSSYYSIDLEYLDGKYYFPDNKIDDIIRLLPEDENLLMKIKAAAVLAKAKAAKNDPPVIDMDRIPNLTDDLEAAKVLAKAEAAKVLAKAKAAEAVRVAAEAAEADRKKYTLDKWRGRDGIRSRDRDSAREARMTYHTTKTLETATIWHKKLIDLKKRMVEMEKVARLDLDRKKKASNGITKWWRRDLQLDEIAAEAQKQYDRDKEIETSIDELIDQSLREIDKKTPSNRWAVETLTGGGSSKTGSSKTKRKPKKRKKHRNRANLKTKKNKII